MCACKFMLPTQYIVRTLKRVPTFRLFHFRWVCSRSASAGEVCKLSKIEKLNHTSWERKWYKKYDNTSFLIYQGHFIEALEVHSSQPIFQMQIIYFEFRKYLVKKPHTHNMYSEVEPIYLNMQSQNANDPLFIYS